MTAWIRATRPEVTDRFPMLGLMIHTDGPPQRAEVTIAIDPGLFRPERKADRRSTNFYSSRASGPVSVPRGEAIYIVPPGVLARFIGQDRVYVALATTPEGTGGATHVDVLPNEGSPYISLKNLTGRSMKRVRLLPSRQERAAGYGGDGQKALEWAGDAAVPGMQKAPNITATAPTSPAAARSGNGKDSDAPSTAPVMYDDGFTPPLPPPNHRASPSAAPDAPAARPTAQSYSRRAARSQAQEELPADDYGIDGPIPNTEPTTVQTARAMDAPLRPEYPRASRFAPAHPSNYHVASKPRSIDRLVIHITDGGSRIAGTIGWFQNPNQRNSRNQPIHVSAHYVVGQDGEVVQMVRNNDIAHHASQANTRSIGIEHVANSKGLMPTEAEYQASADLVAWLCAELGISADREHIVGHHAISPRDQHDDCPDSVWDWDHYMDLVQAAAASLATQLPAATLARAQDMQDTLKSELTQIAAASDIARYSWNDRGVAPAGYIKGMALVYARVYGKLKAGDAAAIEMAKAKTADSDRDALTWYDDIFAAAGMGNDTDGVDTLRHLFVLLIGLGMRESSGRYCEGRDRSAENTSADTAEAGLFQTSFNARTASALLPALFAQYSANPSGFLDVFREGVQPSAADLENFGSGDGMEFQRLSKGCPAFAAEFAGVGLRNIRKHWGPITRRRAEVRPECDAMLRQVEACVDASTTSEALSARAAAGQKLSRALVVDLEDRQKARKYGPPFRELFQWAAPESVVREIEARGFKVQTIDAAIGDLNLDRYPVAIARFPEGWDAPRLLQYFIRNINQFIDTDLTEFIPYDETDAQRLASSNPKGTVFKLDFLGPDNAAIVISAAEPQFYIVTTINTPWSGDHPVSGHRQFGYIVEDGKTTFYTRGADRATLGFPGTESAIFYGGEKLWEGFQSKLAAFINDNGGTAEIIPPFSERFNATAMREEFGRFDVAESLAAAQAKARALTISRPTTPRTSARRLATAQGMLDVLPVDLKLRVFIPSPAIFMERPIISNRTFGGDGRSFQFEGGTSRAEIQARLHFSNDTSGPKLTDIRRAWGESTEYRPEDTEDVPGKPSWYRNKRPGATPIDRDTLGVTDKNLSVELGGSSVDGMISMAEGSLVVTFHVAGSLPLVTGSPDIDANLAVHVKIDGDRVNARVHGGHDEFPAYEVYANGILIYSYNPLDHGGTPLGLIGTGDFDVEPDTDYVDVGPATEFRVIGPVRIQGRAPAAQSLARAGALGNDSFTLNWGDVELIPQPTGVSCWSAAAAMMIGWRDRVSITPESMAEIAGRSLDQGMNREYANVKAFAQMMGLAWEEPQSYSVEGFRRMLENYGPLWVTKEMAANIPNLHAVIVTGLYSDGTNTFLRITDPWDREVGTPGSPGSYLDTHATGSRYIMGWDQFMQEYEWLRYRDNQRPKDKQKDYLHILHAEGTEGRVPDYGPGTPAGYAQSLRGTRFPPPPKACSFDAPSVLPAWPAHQRVRGGAANVSWELDQYDGMKAPAGMAVVGAQVPTDGTTITLTDWPYIDAPAGRTYAVVMIDWRHQGGMVGDVRIAVPTSKAPVGYVLKVTADIADGPDTAAIAALRITVRHEFSCANEPNQVAVTEVTLFGDGRYQRENHWEQQAQAAA